MLPLSRLPQAGEAAPGAQEQQQSLGTVGGQGMLRPRDLEPKLGPQGPPLPARGLGGALNATKLLVTGFGGKKASKSRGKLTLDLCLKPLG